MDIQQGKITQTGYSAIDQAADYFTNDINNDGYRGEFCLA